MKQIVAWVPKNKQEELIAANKIFNVPIVFVDSVSDLENNLDGYAIFYPPAVVSDDNFLGILRKYPMRTFHAICDIIAFGFYTNMMLIDYQDVIPDNPDVPIALIKRFLEMHIR